MFKTVNPKEDFPEMERRILEWWYKAEIVKKYLHKNDSSKKNFSFLDGPITANNPMGVHHAWGRTYKDLWQRFFNMRGFRQRFQNGFDNQGLWVEVEVEKELGFKSKKDIEKYGIEKFVNKCKERTLYFAKVQTEQSKRLGYFMDWDNSYYTLSDENNYMIWYFLKKCWTDGNLYKGKDSVPWCPRCGTAISQHEILTEEYQEITHKSVFVKYPIQNRKNEFLLVWTTTPWTIPGNVALTVNPDFLYAKFKNKKTGEILIFLKDLAGKILKDKEWEKVGEFPGTKLSGFQYLGPFDDLPVVEVARKENPKTFHTVVLDKDLVTAAEGTGIVHLAPGAGQEDFQIGKRENLPVVALIDEEGAYLDGLDDLSRANAKEKPDLIFEKLKNKEEGKFFFKLEDYTHRYPVCWRCKTELVWRVVDEWYIAMDAKVHPGAKNYRNRMIEVAKKICWLPKWGLERELDWLSNMQDWLISKKRYWGLALPIWECQKCGKFTILGGKEELKQRAVEGYEGFAEHSPHRPWIDEVKIKCSCGETISRIPDVGNPWLDAGIVSFSTMPKDWFPADFITESFPGQFKNWFYSLLAMATILEDKPPFKTVLGFATLLAEDGRPMHKSLGNAIEFNEGAGKIGVDVMRWMYVTQNPEINLNFGYHVADETRRRFHLMLWNIYNFFMTYANIDKIKNEKLKIKNDNEKSENVLDRWILSRLNELIQVVTDSLENYDAFTASHAIEDFVNDLSTWYVRRSRDRVGPAVEDGEDKNACYATLYEALVTLSKLLAPFTPFLAEEIYQNLKTGSVHLENWPSFAKASEGQAQLIKHMAQVRKICELGHAARKSAKVKVRQPLKKLKIKNEKLKTTNKNEKRELEQLIMDELNVKEIEWVKGKGELGIELDTTITSELRSEGEARELVRQIQELRKKENCALDEKVEVTAPSWPAEFEDYIKSETLAKSIKKGERLEIERL
ncbi:MAG: isoleucine--tRNA ligase [Patescibacteria group bacterium]